MRIVQFVNNLEMGGLERLAVDLAERQLGEGHEPLIYCLTNPGRYADEAIGNMLTEGVLPVLFHQDPRYFRRGPQYGGVWKRTSYALAQVIVTHKDGGGYQFNYSEWVGNGIATAFGNVYHVDNRNALDNTTKLLEQVGTDAVSQVIKEFWPDIKKKFFHKGGG